MTDDFNEKKTPFAGQETGEHGDRKEMEIHRPDVNAWTGDACEVETDPEADENPEEERPAAEKAEEPETGKIIDVPEEIPAGETQSGTTDSEFSSEDNAPKTETPSFSDEDAMGLPDWLDDDAHRHPETDFQPESAGVELAEPENPVEEPESDGDRTILPDLPSAAPEDAAGKEAPPSVPWIRRFAYPLTGAALLIPIFVFLVLTLDAMGLTDDDDFYVPASKNYILWAERAVKGLFKGEIKEFRKSAVERGWRSNHEHPSVAKLGMGVTWLIFHKYLDWMGEIDAARLGVILFAMLLLYLIFRFSWETFGPRVAIFAVLALVAMPRTFFHMHVATLDIPTTATYFLVFYAAWRAEKSRLWVILAGLLYGVAIGTKLNGPFVVFPLVLYCFYRWRQYAVLKTFATLTFRRMIALGLSMALLSFPVFWLLWPWIWSDTIDKLQAYFHFHFHHYGIRLLYLGDVHLNPFAPWHAPFVYMLFTVPLVILVLSLNGFWHGLRQLSPHNLKYFPKGPGAKEDYLLHCALHALFAISIVAFPNNPKYGGVKLFQPFFPFLAILSGYGFHRLVERLSILWPVFAARRKVLVPVLMLLVFLPGAIGMTRVYPYMLSYFNSLAGNLQGATEIGMERQYYDMCYKTTIEFWNQYAPTRTKVSYEPNLGEYRRTYPWYKRDGKLRNDIQTGPPNEADFMVLTHERRWSHYQELVQQYRNYPVFHTERVWGTPLYTIYDLRGDRKKKPEKKRKRSLRKKNRKMSRKKVEKQDKKKSSRKKTPPIAVPKNLQMKKPSVGTQENRPAPKKGKAAPKKAP